jgi:hypothetical protein
MNCHGNKDNNGHKGHISHMLMMLLCCGAPVLLLLLLPLLRGLGLSSGASSRLTGLSSLICPVMMLGMMFMMMRGRGRGESKDNCCSDNKIGQEKRIEE